MRKAQWMCLLVAVASSQKGNKIHKLFAAVACCACGPLPFLLQPEACKYFKAISGPPPPKRGKPPYIQLKPKTKATIKVLSWPARSRLHSTLRLAS